jgi:hypothetical protein
MSHMVLGRTLWNWNKIEEMCLIKVLWVLIEIFFDILNINEIQKNNDF